MMVSFELKRDLDMIKKYKDGREADEEDLPVIKMLCSIGLMNRGVSLKRQVITAKSTETGIGLLG
jgi:hypothetical protein